MIRCNCDKIKEFKSQSAYRQHIKSNKHQLWVMRNKELDMDVYCEEIRKNNIQINDLKNTIVELRRAVDIHIEKYEMLKNYYDYDV